MRFVGAGVVNRQKSLSGGYTLRCVGGEQNSHCFDVASKAGACKGCPRLAVRLVYLCAIPEKQRYIAFIASPASPEKRGATIRIWGVDIDGIVLQCCLQVKTVQLQYNEVQDREALLLKAVTIYVHLVRRLPCAA